MASQRVKLKDQILDGVAKSVKEVQAYTFNTDGELVEIHNEARPLQKLVEYLDHAFLHGLKHVSPGYWVFVKCFTHRLLISDIIALDRLATDLGRSRAWLYQSLNERSLESYLRCFLENDSILRKFYVEHAMFRDSERLTLLITLVSGLDHVTFDLDLNVAYFDLVSHIPRSASDPKELRELDDTISLHSNLSLDSVASLANEQTSSIHHDIEVPLDCSAKVFFNVDNSKEVEESSFPATLAEPDHSESCELQKPPPQSNVQSAAVPQPCETQEVEENVNININSAPDIDTNVNSALDLNISLNSTPDLNISVNPAPDLNINVNPTPDLNIDVNSTPDVNINVNSTPDYDINMDDVGEQNTNLEVIRISRKGGKKKKMKKKKQRTNSKGSKAQEQGQQDGASHDRCSSPSTVSVASSCIEELELEDEAGLDRESELSAGGAPVRVVESSGPERDLDLDQRSAGLASLPQSHSTPSGACNGDAYTSHCQLQTETEDQRRLVDCAIVISDLLNGVCIGGPEPLDEPDVTASGAPLSPRTCNSMVEHTKPLPWSMVGRIRQDSFNSSLDVTDHSMVYWQGEVTDNSFDADVSSISQGTSEPYTLKGQKDSELTIGNDSNRTADKKLSLLEKERLSGEIDLCGTPGMPKSDKECDHSNDNSKDRSSEEKFVDNVLSSRSCQDNVLSTRNSQDNMVEASRAILACRSDSLSSGLGSGQETTDNSSDLRTGESYNSSYEAHPRHKRTDSWKLSSGISLVESVDEDDQDSFVVVDVIQDGPDVQEEDEEGERHRGDGQETPSDPLHARVRDLPKGHDTQTEQGQCGDDDGVQVTSHEAEMKVDNNLKLYLMLEIFKIEDEKYHKLLRMSTGHMEGNLKPVFILLTDLAIYILRRGDNNGDFSTESRMVYTELNYILIGLNYQSIQLVCRDRLNKHWLTTGSERLTRFFLHCVKECMSSHYLGSPRVLTDATQQAIGLKKYVAQEEKIKMSQAHTYLYSLVHWEDLLDSSTAADLQLYIPATKQKGMLHYKTRESFFIGSYWKAAYFKLKNNLLKRYGRREDGVPDLIIDLGCHEFGGCRRVHHRPFAFELVYTDGTPPLQLSCHNELHLSQWLHSICEAVAQQSALSHTRGLKTNPCQPACAVITSESLFLCLEDAQTHFFRTLARTNLASIAFIERSPVQYSYLALNFQSCDSDNPWLLYFNCIDEQQKFISQLAVTYQVKTAMNLKICAMPDDKLKQRCSNCQELILSAWQRSDSLKRGRVRGDSWSLGS